MISLNSPLTKALTRSANWSAQDSVRALAVAAEGVPSSVIDWDADAGERWGRLMRGDQVAALVRMDRPLVVVLDELAESLREALPNDAAVVITVATMDGVDFEAEEGLIDSVFPGRARSASFDPRAFSIDDLWFATT